MLPGPKDGRIKSKTFGKPRVFVTSLTRSTCRVPNGVVIWVSDVDFPWRDANDWTILLVQLDDFKGVLAAQNYVVVELIPGDSISVLSDKPRVPDSHIPKSQGRYPRTRDVSNW